MEIKINAFHLDDISHRTLKFVVRDNQDGSNKSDFLEPGKGRDYF
jgi:hypothetical protein